MSKGFLFSSSALLLAALFHIGQDLVMVGSGSKQEDFILLKASSSEGRIPLQNSSRCTLEECLGSVSRTKCS